MIVKCCTKSECNLDRKKVQTQIPNRSINYSESQSSELKLFGNGHSPLFKISKDGRSSHIFGSCHIVPLKKLACTGNFSGNARNFSLLEFLANKHTLVTECGRCFDRGKHDTSHYIPEEWDLHVQFQELCKLYPPAENNLFPVNLLKKNDPMTRILQTADLNGVNQLFLTSYIYLMSTMRGIDTNLMALYNRKTILSLDFDTNDSIKTNHSIKTNRFIKSSIMASILPEYWQSSDNLLDRWNQYSINQSNKYLYQNIQTQYEQFKLRKQYTKYFFNFKYILDERNKKWIPRIERFHRLRGDTLFVAGFGHLFGAKGLIARLHSIGYRVECFDMGSEQFVYFDPMIII